VENLVVSTGFAVVRPREVKPGYLSFVLRASYFVETVVSRSAGVSYPAITASEVGLIHIPVPSEEEQEAIARFLDRQTKKIDELIAAKRALLDLLKEKRQALITHAVTKGLDPNVKLKSSGIDWLGDVPEHWEVLMLKRVWAGCDYGISETLSGDGTVRVLTMSNICDGRVHLPDEGCLEDIQPGLCLRNGDLLFNRTNSLIHVAKVGLYEHTIDTPVTFASYLVRIRMNERALPKFMNFLLNAPLILQFARSLALPSINQANLNPARYGRILIALPPPSEQHEIVGYLMAETAKIDTMLETTAAAIQRLQDYRTSLISAAVTGKIDVRGEPV
jgi:type I restriction enzyme S subunit